MGDSPAGLRASQPAHEIRRFESAVWSLYILSDNTGLPPEARAACRKAADFAAASMRPGDRGVEALIRLVIEVGGGENAPTRELLLARLREMGWAGEASDLDKAPEALAGPPPRNLVSDQLRRDAFDHIIGDIESRLRDNDLPADQRQAYAARLAELRAAPGDVRSKTDRAWALLGVLERNREARTRKAPENP
jgi:hypothetical protein